MAADDLTCEARVLREEAVPGVDRLRTAAQRGLDDAVSAEVALGSRAGAEEVCLIRESDVPGSAIRLRVHGDRADPELAQSPEHTHRDLAAIGDENPVE